jgi:hypothetical protein
MKFGVDSKPGGMPLTKSAKSASVFEGEQVKKGGKTTNFWHFWHCGKE